MNKKILVINFGGLGDQILFFPVLESLKKFFNGSFITLITEPRSKSAINLTDNIDELFISNLKSVNKLIESFRILLKAICGKYDVVISSGSSKFIPCLLFLTGIKRRIGYDSGILSRILLTDPVPLNQRQYAANMYFDLVSPLKLHAKTTLPQVKITLNSEIQNYLEKLILTNTGNRKKILIHPGVSNLSIKKGIIKFWSSENWSGLIKRLIEDGNYTVILTGGPDDRKVLSGIKENLGEMYLKNEYLQDLSAKSFGIEEFTYILQLSDAIVCVDSAPMHIAVGLKKLVLALFGPTNEIKLLPAEKDLFIPIKNEKAKCRPCLWDKKQTSCEAPVCLDIEVDRVFETLKRKLEISF